MAELVQQSRFSSPGQSDGRIFEASRSLFGTLREQREKGNFQRLVQPQAGMAAEGQQGPTRRELMERAMIEQPAQWRRLMDNMGIDNEMKLREAADFAFQARRAAPEMRKQLINERVTKLAAEGRDPQHTRQLLDMSPSDQDDALEVVEMMPLTPKERVSGVGTTAGEREFASLTRGLGAGETEEARRIKLGLAPRASIVTPERERELTLAREGAKLEKKLELDPQIARAVATAKADADSIAEMSTGERSNELGYRLYETAMGNLGKALGETETGAIVGWVPAMSTNQQIAEGAQAVIAPVLKQLFRSAGEGTFTDSDQRLLMGMVPTRKDSPEARVAKMKMIDDVVRAKLGISTPAASQFGTGASMQQRAQQQDGRIVEVDY